MNFSRIKQSIIKKNDVETSIEGYNESFDALARVVENAQVNQDIIPKIGEMVLSRDIRILPPVEKPTEPYDWKKEGDFTDAIEDERRANLREEFDSSLRNEPTLVIKSLVEIARSNDLSIESLLNNTTNPESSQGQ